MWGNSDQRAVAPMEEVNLIRLQYVRSVLGSNGIDGFEGGACAFLNSAFSILNSALSGKRCAKILEICRDENGACPSIAWAY